MNLGIDLGVTTLRSAVGAPAIPAWSPLTASAVLAYWSPSQGVFSDAAGTTPATAGGVVQRMSGQKIAAHLTDTTSPPTLVDDGGRNALAFTAASTQRLAVANTTLMAAITGTNNPYCVTMLVKRGPPGASVTPLSFSNTANTTSQVRHFFGATNTVGVQRPGNASTAVQSGAGAVPADAWYVVTWLFTGSVMIARVNGAEVLNGALSTASISSNTYVLGARFDGSAGTYSVPFDGRIDDHMILDVAGVTADVTSAEAFLAGLRGITLA